MRPTTSTITAYADGPYLVRGPVRIVDEDGTTLEVRRAIVPLCRCGRSRTKPLCDGSHAASPRRVPVDGFGSGAGADARASQHDGS